MSADGDTVRAWIENQIAAELVTADALGPARDTLAALARLETAAAENARLVERGQNLVDGIGMEREMRKAVEAQRDALVEAIETLDASVERMLRHGHDFWERHQHSPESDEMSGALTDLHMALKRARAALAETGLEADTGAKVEP